MTTIETIITQPKVREGDRETMYRSYHILEYVKEMIERGDSYPTMLEVIDFMEKFPSHDPSHD